MLLFLLFVAIAAESHDEYSCNLPPSRRAYFSRTGVCTHFTVDDLNNGKVYRWGMSSPLDSDEKNLVGTRMACKTADRFIDLARTDYDDPSAHVCSTNKTGIPCVVRMPVRMPRFGRCYATTIPPKKATNICKFEYISDAMCGAAAAPEYDGFNADCKFDTRAHELGAICTAMGQCVRDIESYGCEPALIGIYDK